MRVKDIFTIIYNSFNSAPWEFFSFFLLSADYIQNQLFQKIILGIALIRVSNRLDPDQDGCSVGPDLDPICLQRLSADYT